VPIKPFAVPLLAAFALAACGDEPEAVSADDGRGAEGEVLGGSISDDMLPLDQLRSQSPPLREESAPASASGSADTATEPADDPAAEEPPAPEPEPAEEG